MRGLAGDGPSDLLCSPASPAGEPSDVLHAHVAVHESVTPVSGFGPGGGEPSAVEGMVVDAWPVVFEPFGYSAPAAALPPPVDRAPFLAALHDA